jgi:predicted Ser/Thr protein kinase
MKQALSYIPLPISFADNAVNGTSTTYSGSIDPRDVGHWDDFFDEVVAFNFDDQPKFKQPQFTEFSPLVKEDVRDVFNTNICQVLNKLLEPDYKISRKSEFILGDPDFAANFASIQLICPIEIKRRHVLQSILDQVDALHKWHNTVCGERDKLIRQIFTYMSESWCKYGIISTYEQHWFLYRPKENPSKLLITDPLTLNSVSPTVLEAYAYMITHLCKDHYCPHPEVTNDSEKPTQRITRSMTRRKTSHFFAEDTSSSTKRSSSSTKASNTKKSKKTNNQNSRNRAQNFSFMDFKIKGHLGRGRSGKTLLCEYRGNTIALKGTDLSKAPSYVLNEMLNEVEIYEILDGLQGECIPKLVCHGYYGFGMYYVIGTTLAGTSLSKYEKITKQQRRKALNALDLIHRYGVLHNDIREENILFDDSSDGAYLIDFGMACYHRYAKGKRKLFDEEKRNLARILDRYTTLDSAG